MPWMRPSTSRLRRPDRCGNSAGLSTIDPMRGITRCSRGPGVDAEHRGAAAGRAHEAEEHPDRRGLARAVRPEEPEHAALGHRRGRGRRPRPCRRRSCGGPRPRSLPPSAARTIPVGVPSPRWRTTADLLVIGAGPAGTAAAITAAGAGRTVVVVDRATFPRDKTCGDGLTTGALRWLEALGVPLDALGASARGPRRRPGRAVRAPHRGAAPARRRARPGDAPDRSRRRARRPRRRRRRRPARSGARSRS